MRGSAPDQGTPPASRETESPLPFAWAVWLAREQPGRAAAIVALILAAGALMRLVAGQYWAAPLTLALLFISLRDFLLPVRFVLTAQYAEARGLILLHRIEWSQVRSAYRDAEGIKLSPLAGRSRLEAYRGVYLRVPPEQRAMVTEIVRRMMAKEGAC